MIPVTKPFFPPESDYRQYVARIWQNGWLTNDGPLVQQLERDLSARLGVRYGRLVANGTLALQLMLERYELAGSEVITTPFSYIATLSAILAAGAIPVMSDIDPDTFNIDPEKVEQAITPRTKAILAVHCFGNPCNIEALQAIAQRHQLCLLFDAAHAFGVQYKGQSLLNYGDASALSLHATKIYHTVEGGLIVSHHENDHLHYEFLRNFGHNGPGAFACRGVNAKLSEMHAAMGLCMLTCTDKIIAKRKELVQCYRRALDHLPLQWQRWSPQAETQGAYCPVVFPTGELRLKATSMLEEKGIFPRRYFYPSLNALPFAAPQPAMPVAESMADRILCLPLYFDLTEAEVAYIAEIITAVFAENSVPA